MANYAQTVNVIGAIKTSKTAAVLDTTGEVLALYRRRFGTVPVAVQGAPEPLDVAAAWRADRSSLTVGIVNPTPSAYRLAVDMTGIRAPETARAWRITGAHARARNVPGEPPEVTAVVLGRVPFGRTVEVPPLSATIYELPRQ
jgi:alpha-N-arabinofuranosidase